MPWQKTHRAFSVELYGLLGRKYTESFSVICMVFWDRDMHHSVAENCLVSLYFSIHTCENHIFKEVILCVKEWYQKVRVWTEADCLLMLHQVVTKVMDEADSDKDGYIVFDDFSKVVMDTDIEGKLTIDF